MAGAGVVKRCCFEWNIFNPFLLENLQATFHHGSSTVTQWKTTFQAIDRGADRTFTFSFSLETLEKYSHRHETAADVLVQISLNDECIFRRKIYNYHFSIANCYRYNLQETGVMNPEMETHHLVLRIEISLPDGAKRNELFADDLHLQWLSSDMDLLLCLPKYSNMRLLSRNSPKRIKVHSYIMDARWNNFFTLHNFEAGTQDTVELDISPGLLSDILKYMYSSELSKHWPDWKSLEYTAELFQVMNRYKLEHLYKVFVKNDFLQVQVTRNPVLTESLLFPLHIFADRAIKNASRTWHFHPNPEYEIVFQARVWHNAGNILSYSLHSNSLARVYVQVNIEVVKREEGNDIHPVAAFQDKCHTIDPHETVESTSSILLGHFELLDDSPSADGAGVGYFIRCALNVTDATTVDQVESVDDGTLQSDGVRLGVLSDHLYTMKERKLDADMNIMSSDELLMFDDYVDRIHKGILATRVPDWWGGLENVRANGIPDEARSTLTSVTLPFVLDYMYTGRVFSIPTHFMDEVRDFACQSVFSPLFIFICGLSAPISF